MIIEITIKKPGFICGKNRISRSGPSESEEVLLARCFKWDLLLWHHHVWPLQCRGVFFLQK